MTNSLGASLQFGFIWGLGQSNSSYKGPFTSVTIGASIIGATLAASSKGFDNPFQLSTPIVAAAGVQTPGVSFAYGIAYYADPTHVGNLNDTLFRLVFPSEYQYMQDYKSLCGAK